jgi:hypothetical protein
MSRFTAGGSGSVTGEQALAQLAAERHPEALAGEIPEAWAGHDLPFLPSTDPLYPEVSGRPARPLDPFQ